MTKKGTRKPSPPPPAHIKAALRWLSAQTASLGGKARWKGISQAERAAYARKMVEARERKRAKRSKKP